MTSDARPPAGLLRSMVNRTAAEDHRPSSPLELFFDLCFVVAIAQAANGLHHTLDENHVGQGFLGFALVFFGIWWAWVNFTWFASSYDNDDPLYRLAVFVQVAGVLVLAAGTPRAFADRDFGVVVLGYVIMRLALVSLWLRAARDDPARRTTDLRYAGGIVVLQLCWIGLLALPDGWTVPAFLVLAVAEMSVPVFAERAEPLGWHPGHIAERYGLFTIIVLGESVLSATLAIQEALDAGSALADLIAVALSALMIVCSMWWVYFDQRSEQFMEQVRRQFDRGATFRSFLWGYGHYFVFTAAAAVGGGIAVVVDQTLHHAEISATAAALSVAVPAAVYVMAVWALHLRGDVRRPGSWRYPLAACCIVGAAAVGLPVLATGVSMVVLVLSTLVPRWRCP